MTGIGIFGVIAIVVIVLALVLWIYMVFRANRNPVQTKDPGGELKRGPVSGGAIRGDPGQNILTGEAPRQDEPKPAKTPRNSPLDL